MPAGRRAAPRDGRRPRRRRRSLSSSLDPCFRGGRCRSLRFLALALLALLLCKSPAAAFDLFATHEVTVQFATQDGKPMADAEVRVFAPGDPLTRSRPGAPTRTANSNSALDRDGLWTAEARNGTEVVRATVKVGGGSADDQGDMSPYFIVGLLGVLLVVAVCFRFLRARSRTQPCALPSAGSAGPSYPVPFVGLLLLGGGFGVPPGSCGCCCCGLGTTPRGGCGIAFAAAAHPVRAAGGCGAPARPRGGCGAPGTDPRGGCGVWAHILLLPAHRYERRLWGAWSEIASDGSASA